MDIQKITCELLATGLTQQQLADKVPCSQSTVNAFAHGNRGSRPTLRIGMRFIELHAELCGDGRQVRSDVTQTSEFTSSDCGADASSSP